jgi:RHS Repeat
MKSRFLTLATMILIIPNAAHGAETTTYSYDARGRLIKVIRTGTVNNNVQIVYTHDKANNRKTVVVTGSANSSPQ